MAEVSDNSCFQGCNPLQKVEGSPQKNHNFQQNPRPFPTSSTPIHHQSQGSYPYQPPGSHPYQPPGSHPYQPPGSHTPQQTIHPSQQSHPGQPFQPGGHIVQQDGLQNRSNSMSQNDSSRSIRSFQPSSLESSGSLLGMRQQQHGLQNNSKSDSFESIKSSHSSGSQFGMRQGPPRQQQGPSNQHQGPLNPHHGPPQQHQGAVQQQQRPPQQHRGPPQQQQGPPQQGLPQQQQGLPQQHRGQPQQQQGPPNQHDGGLQQQQRLHQQQQRPPQQQQGAPQQHQRPTQRQLGPPQQHQGAFQQTQPQQQQRPLNQQQGTSQHQQKQPQQQQGAPNQPDGAPQKPPRLEPFQLPQAQQRHFQETLQKGPGHGNSVPTSSYPFSNHIGQFEPHKTPQINLQPPTPISNRPPKLIGATPSNGVKQAPPPYQQPPPPTPSTKRHMSMTTRNDPTESLPNFSPRNHLHRSKSEVNLKSVNKKVDSAKKDNNSIAEVQNAKDLNSHLSSEIEELREMCCLLDDDRQSARKLAREWQRFGKYTATVMRQEVANYQEKLEELETKQQEIIKENLELKELCLYLDDERKGDGLCDICDGASSLLPIRNEVKKAVLHSSSSVRDAVHVIPSKVATSSVLPLPDLQVVRDEGDGASYSTSNDDLSSSNDDLTSRDQDSTHLVNGLFSKHLAEGISVDPPRLRKLKMQKLGLNDEVLQYIRQLEVKIGQYEARV